MKNKTYTTLTFAGLMCVLILLYYRSGRYLPVVNHWEIGGEAGQDTEDGEMYVAL